MRWDPAVTRRPSAPDVLTLHAIRLLGMASPERAARRFGLDPVTVSELLLDFEAYGWVRYSEFAGIGGWSLTEVGRHANEVQLADELVEVGARAGLVEIHRDFLPVNARFLDAVTRWQVRPLHGAPLAANDHQDHRWDDRVLDDLASLGRRLDALGVRLADLLARLDGYGSRYAAAVERAVRGEAGWVDDMARDSCHKVWFELHEDLISSLGLTRESES